MKRKENHNNFIIIFISFICYTIVFVLYVLQDKIWHIVMLIDDESTCRRGCSQPIYISPILEKGSFGGQVSCPGFLVSVFMVLAQLEGPGHVKAKNCGKIFFVSQINASSLVCQRLSTDIHMIVNK